MCFDHCKHTTLQQCSVCLPDPCNDSERTSLSRAASKH